MKKSIRRIIFVLLIIPCLFLFGGCNLFEATKTVTDIQKTSSTAVGEVYTITYSDGTTSSFTIENGEDGKDLNIEDIYNVAKENGYTGTFLDFLDDYLDIGNSDANKTANVSKALLSSVAVCAEFPVNTGSFLSDNKDTIVGSGAGVIYKLDKSAGNAYIITNYHVVYYASSVNTNKISTNIKCFLYGASIARGYKVDSSDNKVYDANGYPIIEYAGNAIDCTYVGGSMTHDIAVLKVSASEILKNSDARAVDVVNSDNIDVGGTAIAIGNPEGSGISVTEGVVSVDSEYLTMTGADEQTEVTFRVMRIDTAVNSGNSGGGLYNANGELIGIVNAKIIDDEVENIGYAIPSNIATRVADNIIKNNSDPRKVTIGITIEAKNSRSVYDATTGKISIVEDIYVKEITQNSLASTSSLEVGDKITKIIIKGKEYSISRMYQVIDLVWFMEVGDVVQFVVEGKASNPSIVINASYFNEVE